MKTRWEDSEIWNEIDPLDLSEALNEKQVEDSWNIMLKRNARRSAIKWFRYAAIMVFAMVAVGYWYFDVAVVRVIAHEKIVHHVFPDSSEVWLKPNSTLTYSNAYNLSNRTVKLNGTGYFLVQNNPSLPFTAQSKQSKVQVLGTSFLFQTGMEEIIQVRSGSVKYSNSQEQYMLLEAGEQIQRLQDGKASKIPYDVNNLSWRTNYLEFVDEPLDSILMTLSQYYGTRLSCNDTANIRLSATFDHKSLEEVVQLIEFATNASVEVSLNKPD